MTYPSHTPGTLPSAARSAEPSDSVIAPNPVAPPSSAAVAAKPSAPLPGGVLLGVASLGLTALSSFLLYGFLFVYVYFLLWDTSRLAGHGGYDFGRYVWNLGFFYLSVLVVDVGLLVTVGLMLARREGGRVLGLVMAGAFCLAGKNVLLHYVVEPDLPTRWYGYAEIAHWIVLPALVLAGAIALARRSSVEWFEQRRRARG